MKSRPYTDFPRNEQGLVDNFIGTAYDVVKNVSDNMPELGRLDDVLAEIPALAVTTVNAAVNTAMVPVLATLDGKVQEASDLVVLASLEVTKAENFADAAQTSAEQSAASASVAVETAADLASLKTIVFTSRDYASGLLIEHKTQLVRRSGELYEFTGSIPYTTTGNWVVESASFKAFTGDGVLRSELISQTGATIVKTSDGRTVEERLAERRTVSSVVAGGIVDATTAIQAAIAALPFGATLDGCNMTFMVTKLHLKSDMRFINFNLLTKAGALPGDFWSPVTVGDYGDTSLHENIEIENVHVNGQRVLQETGSTGGEDGGKHGFRFIGRIRNLTVRKCSAMYCGSYGFFNFVGIGSGSNGTDTAVQQNIRYLDCVGMFNKIHGMAGDSIDGIEVGRCKFTQNGKDITGSPGARITPGGLFFGCGIDFEGYGIDSILKNVHVYDTDLRDNASASIFITDVVLATNPIFKIRRGFLIQNCQMTAGGAGSNSPNAAFTTSTPFDHWTLGPVYDDIKLLGCDIVGNIDIVNATNVVIDSKQANIGTYLGAVAYSTITVNNKVGVYFNNQAASTINYSFEYGESLDSNGNRNWFRKEADGWIRQGLFSARVAFTANEEKTLSVAYLRGLHGPAHSAIPVLRYVSIGPDVRGAVLLTAGDSNATVYVKNGATAQTIGVYCEIAGQ